MSDDQFLTQEVPPLQDLPPAPAGMQFVTPDLPPQRSTAPSTRDAVTEAAKYLTIKRDDLLKQVADIENFLGFANLSEDLAVRVAKLEKFLGLKG